LQHKSENSDFETREADEWNKNEDEEITEETSNFNGDKHDKSFVEVGGDEFEIAAKKMTLFYQHRRGDIFMMGGICITGERASNGSGARLSGSG
jgi:hypothetical protein